MSQGPRFCWILESDLRDFLQKQKRDGKHGKSRKLSKADMAAVEEKLSIHDMKNFIVSRVPNQLQPIPADSVERLEEVLTEKGKEEAKSE